MAANRVLEATAVDEVMESAESLIAARESVVSQTRLTRMRAIRDELDDGIVDINDPEAMHANTNEALRRAKIEVPDDPDAAQLRSQLEELRMAEKELTAAQAKVTSKRATLEAKLAELNGGPPSKKRRAGR